MANRRTFLKAMIATPMIPACKSKPSSLFATLQPGIAEVLGQRFYMEKVHTYVLDLPDKVLLFDLPVYDEALRRSFESRNKPVVALLSHGSCGIEDGTKWQQKIGLKVFAHKLDAKHPWLKMKPDVFFETPPRLAPHLEIIHSPGHSAGSVCLFDSSTKSLLTGDTIHGNKDGSIRDFTTSKPESYEDPDLRLASCRKLLGIGFQSIYPFHYNPILGDARQKLSSFLERKAT